MLFLKKLKTLLKLFLFFLFIIICDYLSFFNNMADAAASTDVVITGIPSGASGNITIPFSINNASTAFTIDGSVEKIEILSAGGDNGLSFTFNGDPTTIYYGTTDCFGALDPSNIYPDAYPAIWVSYIGQGVKSKLINGANTIDGVIYNCSGGPYSGNITLRIYYYDPACTLSANPAGVFSGNTATIEWTVANTTTATIDNGIGALTPAEIVAGSGTKTTPPITSSVTYNLSVTGPGGTGSCGPVIVGLLVPPTGGLVPCGRLADNTLTTDIDESKPCALCALFYMLKNIINFVMTLAIGIGVFILVIAGLLYATAAGNTRKIELAKSAVTSAIIGISIIFIAWMAIAVILQGMGYANMATWNQVNCVL